jgi:chromosome segregation ATPase
MRKESDENLERADGGGGVERALSGGVKLSNLQNLSDKLQAEIKEAIEDAKAEIKEAEAMIKEAEAKIKEAEGEIEEIFEKIQNTNDENAKIFLAGTIERRKKTIEQCQTTIKQCQGRIEVQTTRKDEECARLAQIRDKLYCSLVMGDRESYGTAWRSPFFSISPFDCL